MTFMKRILSRWFHRPRSDTVRVNVSVVLCPYGDYAAAVARLSVSGELRYNGNTPSVEMVLPMELVIATWLEGSRK